MAAHSDIYSLADTFVPKPKIKRPFGTQDVIDSAAESSSSLLAAQRARWASTSDGPPSAEEQPWLDHTPLRRAEPATTASPYADAPTPDDGAARRAANEALYRRMYAENAAREGALQQARQARQQQQSAPAKSYNPMIPSAQQQSSYGPTSRPPMETPPQDSLMTTAIAASVASRPPMETPQDDPVRAELDRLAREVSAGRMTYDDANRQAEAFVNARAQSPNTSPAATAAPKPGANAIFRPRPEVGGRPENIADNVARETIARAAVAQATGDPNAEALMDQAATQAWQREASINGNVRGDVSAPRDYIESWKGQVRAGGEGSPFADMFNRATQAARASVAAERYAQTGAVATAPAIPPQPRRGSTTADAQSFTTERGPASAVPGQYTTTRLSPPAASAPLPPIAGGNRDDFIRTAAPYAQRVEQQTGVPAKLVMAVAANETGWGNPKYVLGNNYFGIQAQQGEAGEGYTDRRADGTPYQARLKTFATPEEGFRGFADFLLQNPRYKPALDKYRTSGDVNQLAADIHGAGYAEDPQYASKVQSIMAGMPDFPPAESPSAAPPGVATQRMAATAAGLGLVDRAMLSARRPQVLDASQTAPVSAPVQAAQAGVSEQQQTQAVKSGQSVWELGKLTPNQISAATSEGLDNETALAVCGPAAAIAFARKMGRNPTMTEAVNLAKQVGWTAAAGMAGPASQLKLLQNMGIPASLEEGAPTTARVAASVQRGDPVAISTRGHYYVAEGYDPATGKFDFGESARVLKASGGNSWYTLDEIASLNMGEPRAALYMGAR